MSVPCVMVADCTAGAEKCDTGVNLLLACGLVAESDAQGPRPRELRARGRRTRARLLDAGITVFAERGFHAARVDDVVKKARASHGTFYLYFANKEELFQALATEVASEMLALAEEFPALDGPHSSSSLRPWLERFAALYTRHAAVIRTWTEAEIVDTEFGRVGGDLVVGFGEQVAQRVRAAAPDLDPRVTALALVAMIERIHYLIHTGQLRLDHDAVLDVLADVIARSVRPAATS